MMSEQTGCLSKARVISIRAHEVMTLAVTDFQTSVIPAGTVAREML